MKKILCVILSVVVLLGITFTSEVHANKTSVLDEFVVFTDDLLGDYEYEDLTFEYSKIRSDISESYLVDILNGTEAIGYAIVNNSEVVEFSPKESLYHKASLDKERYQLFYSPLNYYVFDKQLGVYAQIDPSGDLNYLSNVSPKNYTIPGIHPGVQTGSKCQAAAAANLLKHYSNHGYHLLFSNLSFTQVQNEIYNILGNLPGGRTNNNIPEAIRIYAKRKSSAYIVGGKVIWGPSYSNVVGEISNNRPCLVGFKAGHETYNSHMTMCYGYKQVNGNKYITIADGWSTSPVVVRWSSYNDCVIRINLSLDNSYPVPQPYSRLNY